MSGFVFEKTDGKMLLSSFGIWLLSAAVLLGITACVIHATNGGEKAISYASSALSFAAALFAGIHAISRRGTGALLTGIITGVAIVVFLLTVGFVAEGSELSPDGVLSVVTFSLSGCVTGAILFSGKSKKVNKKKKVHVKK